jgi:hypothetical protein
MMPHYLAGVTYADVAGIDKVKGDIQVAMDMLLGAPAFRAMGARPFRVRTCRTILLPYHTAATRVPDSRHVYIAVTLQQHPPCRAATCSEASMLMPRTAGHPSGGAAWDRQDVPGQGDGGGVRGALLQRQRRGVRGDVSGHSRGAHPLAVPRGAQGRALHPLHRWVPAAADSSVALHGAHGGVLVAYLHRCQCLLHRD